MQQTTVEIPLDDELLKVLGSESRRAILSALQERRMTGTELATKLDLGKPAVSEHLKKLHECGLVDRHDDAERRWVYFSLSKKGKDMLEPKRTRFILILGIAIGAMLLGAALSSSLYGFGDVPEELQDPGQFKGVGYEGTLGENAGTDAVALQKEGTYYLIHEDDINLDQGSFTKATPVAANNPYDAAKEANLPPQRVAPAGQTATTEAAEEAVKQIETSTGLPVEIPADAVLSSPVTSSVPQIGSLPSLQVVQTAAQSQADLVAAADASTQAATDAAAELEDAAAGALEVTVRNATSEAPAMIVVCPPADKLQQSVSPEPIIETHTRTVTITPPVGSLALPEVKTITETTTTIPEPVEVPTPQCVEIPMPSNATAAPIETAATASLAPANTSAIVSPTPQSEPPATGSPSLDHRTLETDSEPQLPEVAELVPQASGSDVSESATATTAEVAEPSDTAAPVVEPSTSNEPVNENGQESTRDGAEQSEAESEPATSEQPTLAPAGQSGDTQSASNAGQRETSTIDGELDTADNGRDMTPFVLVGLALAVLAATGALWYRLDRR